MSIITVKTPICPSCKKEFRNKSGVLITKRLDMILDAVRNTVCIKCKKCGLILSYRNLHINAEVIDLVLE